MNHEERLQLAKRLINEEIDKNLSMWSTPEDLHTYSWRWRDADTVANDHGDQFFYADKVITICNALDVHYMLTICNNEDGEPTPALHIW